MFSFAILIAGLILLLFAGDYLVRGAVALAEKLGISPLIIGLTIVAFGTSAPELFVSLEAAFNNASGIALGNVVGSNIANVLLVLGAPALIKPVGCKEDGLRFSLAVMCFMTGLLMAIMATGWLSRFDGMVLFALLCIFLFRQFLNARKSRKEQVFGDYHDEIDELPTENSKDRCIPAVRPDRPAAGRFAHRQRCGRYRPHARRLRGSHRSDRCRYRYVAA